MPVQQYKLMHVEAPNIGAFVFPMDGSEVVCGFVSEVTPIYLQVTLFEPIEDDQVPEVAFDRVSSVDYPTILKETIPLMNENLIEMWQETAIQTEHPIM